MPHAPFVVPALLLALVLTVSAIAKLRDPRDTSTVFRQLDLPRVLLRLRAPQLLPYGELALVLVFLVSTGVAYLAATTVMLALFLAYAVVIGRALRLPYPITCGCFGRLGLGLVTGYTLVRNLLLVAIALVAWLDAWRGDGVGVRLWHLGAGWWWLAGTALTVLTTVLVVREGPRPPMVPSSGDDEATYVARPIPYALVDGPGGPGPLWRLTDAAARLLVFYRPDADNVDELVARVPRWAEQIAPVHLHLVGPGEWSALCHYHPALADRLLGDPDLETSRRLGVYSTPTALLLGTDRLLAGGPAEGLTEIDELVDAAAEEIRAASAAGAPDHEPTDSREVRTPAQ